MQDSTRLIVDSRPMELLTVPLRACLFTTCFLIEDTLTRDKGED